MKRTILSIIAIFIGFVSANAQIDFDADTATLIMENGVASKATIKLTNNTGQDVFLRWTLISSTLNDNDDGDADNSNNYSLQFCECNTCYTNDFAELPGNAQCSDPLGFNAGANSQEWYLTVDPNGQAIIDGEWIIQVENLTDNVTDTLVYLALAPNSVTEVNAFAEVRSFPNPAKDQLVIDYSLKNSNDAIVKVYNLLGGELMTFPLTSPSAKVTVNTSELNSGIYFFVIEDAGRRLAIQKFNVVH